MQTKAFSPRRVAAFLLALCVLLCAAVLAAPAVSADPAAAKVHHLRVGFYGYDGYNMFDANDRPCGYDYDVLQKLAEYENLTYEYLGFDQDTEGVLQMLENRELDLAINLRKTPEREERFVYSSQPIGSICTMLTVKAGNSHITAGDYDSYRGMKVGMSYTNNNRNLSFENFAAENGFTYEAIYFDDDDLMATALQQGQIDAAVSNGMRATKNEWVLETFDEQESYIVMRAKDYETQSLINSAMAKLSRAEPGWRSALTEKYSSNHTSNKISLTDQESKFVQKLNSEGRVFTVLANPDSAPYSYLDKNGAPTGILVDLMDKVAARAGLHIQILDVADRAEYEQVLASGAADFCLDMPKDAAAAEAAGYKLTDTYLTADCSWVSLRSSDNHFSKVAVADSSLFDFSQNWSRSYQSVSYPSYDACLAALRSGEVDAYFTYRTQAERLIYEDPRNDLKTVDSDCNVDFAVGVSQQLDVELIGILNKSIDSLTRSEVFAITNDYTNLGQLEFSIVRLFYQYPALIVLATVCVVLLIGCAMLMIRDHRTRADIEKALHKAEEASRAKTEFLSNMSHDIRTPINGIMGMIDIAQTNFDDRERVADCLKKMRGAASHLLSLINDVLDMSKVESGTLQMLDNPFDLRVLLDSCCAIVEGQIAEHNLTFTKQIGPFWHPFLRGSELHIRQVLINILSNAVKYTPDGGTINFCASETLCEEGLVHLRMEIRDNGIGMSEEFLQHIFEPFTQEAHSSRTTYKGTGLGMAITKKLVDQMHGSLDVESEPGKGTTFTVRLSLPLGKAVYNESAQLNKAPDDLHGLHLLLAEDNELNREIAVALLEEQGAEITAVVNGREAVEAVKDAPPGAFDAVLMDVMMPEMNGLEATRAIRAWQQKPKETGIPIIAMTANVFADDVKACLDAGMNSHVGKPLDMKLLMAEILRLTRK